MANWFHRFLNPHCPECSAERICNSCENLKTELARVRQENERLLNKILNPSIPQENRVELPQEIKLPRTVPWHVRRQMLEAEDRERAKLMKSAPKPQSTKELERELGVEES